MNKLESVAAGIVLLFAGLSAFAQSEQSGMIKTDGGVLVVWNEPGNYFTIEIKGREIVPISGRPLWFTVDGKFFQIVTTGKAQFAKGDKPNDRSILEAHRQWESDYIAGMLGGRKLDVRSTWVKTAAGADALQWSFEVPKMENGPTVLRQLYLSVVKPGPRPPTQHRSDARRRRKETLATPHRHPEHPQTIRQTAEFEGGG